MLRARLLGCFVALLFLLFGLNGCALDSTLGTSGVASTKNVASPVRVVKIGLALGGGAARGFAHIGVIKALESQGIFPDIIVGTSAGSVVGALYAAGNSGFALQKLAHGLDQAKISDWSFPDRGVLKGDALQNWVNEMVGQRPLEGLAKPFAAVATDLNNGESVAFRTGNTGMAVRASSTVPGIFQPVQIQRHEYVDGGLSSVVPVRAARQMGSDVVIAVDISAQPESKALRSTLDVLLQTVTIMGRSLVQHELKEADVVIRPAVGHISSTDFIARHDSILEGERAAMAMIPQIKEVLRKAAKM